MSSVPGNSPREAAALGVPAARGAGAAAVVLLMLSAGGRIGFAAVAALWLAALRVVPYRLEI